MKIFLSSNTIINEIFPKEQKKSRKFQHKGKIEYKNFLLENIVCCSPNEMKKKM